MKNSLKVLALAALALPLAAQETTYQSASQGGRWLNLPYSTRAAGLAGLGSTGQGVDSLSYNPAGLAGTQDLQIGLGESQWLDDASSQRLGLALPLAGGGLGLAFDQVDFGSVDLYSVNSQDQVSSQGSTRPGAWALQLGYGQQWGHFSLGAAVKGLNQDLNGQTQSGYSLDLGSGAKLGDLSLGLSLLQALGSLGSDKLPANLDLGADWKAWGRAGTQVNILVGADWQASDGQATAALGLEVSLEKMLILRGGYRAANDQSVGGWAVGAGVWPLDWLGLDYAYNALGGLQATNQLAMNVRWGAWNKAQPEAAPTPQPTATPSAEEERQSQEQALAKVEVQIQTGVFAGDFKQAETALQQRIERTPEDAYLQSRLGYVYLHQGRFDEARQAWEKAVQLGNNEDWVKAGLKSLKGN